MILMLIIYLISRAGFAIFQNSHFPLSELRAKLGRAHTTAIFTSRRTACCCIRGMQADNMSKSCASYALGIRLCVVFDISEGCGSANEKLCPWFHAVRNPMGQSRRLTKNI